MILHGFAWRSFKNMVFRSKTLIFDKTSKRYQKSEKQLTNQWKFRFSLCFLWTCGATCGPVEPPVNHPDLWIASELAEPYILDPSGPAWQDIWLQSGSIPLRNSKMLQPARLNSLFFRCLVFFLFWDLIYSFWDGKLCFLDSSTQNHAEPLWNCLKNLVFGSEACEIGPKVGLRSFSDLLFTE